MSTYTAERIAREIIESGKSVPPLPAASQRLMIIARQPIDQIDVASFSKLVEGDPALTAKLLQLSNSSFFGTLKAIKGVRQAITHIGLQETVTSVLSFLFREALPQFPKLKKMSGDDYWEHSLGCATANRMLGHPVHAQMTQAVPGELYIIGLLSNIGKIFLAINRPADFERCLDLAHEQNLPLAEAQKQLFGTTDNEVAYHVLQHWNLPETICLTIRHYRSPGAAGKELRGIAALTQLAHYMVNISGIGNNGDQYPYQIEDSYVFENWMFPQAEKQKQAKVIEDIFKMLEKRAGMMNPDNDPQEKPEASVPPAKAAAPQNKKKKGMFGKLLSMVK
ncbi:MAG: HDOD domain-containing protein [Desulfobulbaceae bacterium]|nr:MAG: HDOD domain-containing protein [Desulfobulbaceae bacterium]